MDFYLLKNNLNDNENNIYQKWLEGWSIPNISPKDEFKNKLELAGFKNIEYHRKTPLIKKSSQIMHEGAQKRFFYLMNENQKNKIPESLIGHNLAGYVQKDCIEKKIWKYGVFVADK